MCGCSGPAGPGVGPALPGFDLHSQLPAAAPIVCRERSAPAWLCALPPSALHLRTRMLPKLLTSIFGSRNDRLLKQYRQVVAQVNALEPQFEALDDARCAPRPTSSASAWPAASRSTTCCPRRSPSVREASKRVLKMRHFDVQLIGGMALHDGKIAEMRTGEGKTLMATLPVYLNALTGKGVHVVTVNDYLARRDAEWMGRLYNFLGLTVGVNLPQMTREEKQAAYAADVTYGTNNEFGFDYLRDNMVQDTADRVARGLSYAIVDEVDSILIDEARTPLIISGQAEDHTEMYVRINAVVPEAEEADRRARPAHRRGRDRAGRLHRRREDAPGLPDRGRPRERRAPARARPACWPRARACTTRPTSR